MSHSAKFDHNFRGLPIQTFSGAEVKRHALPAPIVDRKPQCDKCFSLGIRCHTLFFPVTRNFFSTFPSLSVLPTHNALMNVMPVNRPNGVKNIHFLIANFVSSKRNHWFHCNKTEQLH